MVLFQYFLSDNVQMQCPTYLLQQCSMFECQCSIAVRRAPKFNYFDIKILCPVFGDKMMIQQILIISEINSAIFEFWNGEMFRFSVTPVLATID